MACRWSRDPGENTWPWQPCVQSRTLQVPELIIRRLLRCSRALFPLRTDAESWRPRGRQLSASVLTDALPPLAKRLTSSNTDAKPAAILKAKHHKERMI